MSEQSVVRVVASEQQRRLAGVGRKRRGDSTRDSAEAVFGKLLNPNAPVRLHHGDIQCHDISKSMQWSQLYLARGITYSGNDWRPIIDGGSRTHWCFVAGRENDVAISCTLRINEHVHVTASMIVTADAVEPDHAWLQRKRTSRILCARVPQSTRNELSVAPLLRMHTCCLPGNELNEGTG